MPLVILNKTDGFTLLEVMVAIFILAVGMFGLLTTVNVAMEHNLKNHLRDEAIEIGAKYMNDLRQQGINEVKDEYPVVKEPSKIRASGKTYSVERSSQVLADDPSGPTSVQLNVVVRWGFKNWSSQNRVVSIITR